MLRASAEPALREWADNTFLLSSQDDSATPYPLDAIFIPTLGQRENLSSLIEACKARAAEIFLLSSGHDLRRFPCIEGTIVIEDIPEFFGIPEWELDPRDNPSATWRRRFDLPAKRNFALQLARDRQFGAIALIDDDIVANDSFLCVPDGLLRASHDMVGFYSLSYPDVSVIDHAERILTLAPSRVSPSGNCLIIRTEKVGGYFPYIYNEDWFFVIGAARGGAKLLGGGYVAHGSHEPWLDLDRVRFEQFGDVAAAGLAELGIRAALPGDIEHWAGTYSKYLIRLRHLRTLSGEEGELSPALEAAIEAVTAFRPEDVHRFVERWSGQTTGGR